MVKKIQNHKVLVASSVILTVGFVYAYSRLTTQDILMRLPKSIRYIMLESSIKNKMIVTANIHNNSLWVIYKLDPKKLGEIKDRIPKHLQLIPHKIFATDTDKNYYLMYNMYLSGFKASAASNIYSIRLEINVICHNPATKNNCFVIIDYYTDGMRFDPANPFGTPNCVKLTDDIQNGFHVDGDILKCGIKNNQGSNDVMWEYQGKIKSGNILEPDNGFLYANKEFYFGSTDSEILEKYGFSMFGEFDAKEHNHYTEIEKIKIVNNLFGEVIEEYVTSFVIPNSQYYSIKMASTQSHAIS